MKISYLTCDFCDASTNRDKSVVIYTNKGRRCSENMYSYICSECIKAASESLNATGESFYLGVARGDRDFKEVKS